MKKRLLAGLLTVVLLLAVILPAGVVLAADPEVTITVTAQVISITNTQATWGIGNVEADDIVYFSATGAEDVDYSQVENTGNVAVDVEIQGENIEGGSYDWTLAATAGVEQYCLYANTEGTPTTYDIEIKSSAYNDLKGNLAASATWDWSMKFTAPTGFNVLEDGAEKTTTITLVASKYVP